MSISEHPASPPLADDDVAQEEQVVLYVEDNPVNAVLMRGIFTRRHQYRLVVAADGAQAMRMAATLRPALLMLDLRLPDCHGLDLLHRLRRLPHCSHIPAVAVTAELDIRPAEGGFDEVWNKPLDLLHLLRRVDRLLDPDYEEEPLQPPSPALFADDLQPTAMDSRVPA
jgi:CheY-like chemotaxis protein